MSANGCASRHFVMFLYSTPLGHQLLALMGGAAVACVVSKRAIRKSPVPPKQLTDLLTHFNFWHLSDCVHRREKRGGGGNRYAVCAGQKMASATLNPIND